MKKTLRTILAGAVALLAVSCYDDSGLQDGLGKLGDKYDELGDKYDELKDSMIDASQLGLSRTDFFLRYTASKTIQLTSENIAEYYVMAKPDGWKASFEGTALTVTAPTRAAVNIGAAETEGEVLIHATSVKGECKVAKLDVTTGPGLTLAVDINGNITVENSYTGEKTNMWGETSFGFSDFILGLATPADFTEDPAAYLETYNTTWEAPNPSDLIFPSMYNVAEQGIYVEGEYETDVVRANVSEAYKMMLWEDLPTGAHYVVWVAPCTSDGKAVIEDMVYVEYVNLVHKVEVKSVSHCDVTLTAECSGAQSYIINAVAESYYNDELNPMTFEEYMNAPMGGPWANFKSYGAAEALGMGMPSVPAEFSLSEILGGPLAFGETYKIWIMPLLAHKNKLDPSSTPDWPMYDYSAYDFATDFLPYVIEVKTNDIVAGSDKKATYTFNANDYTSIKVDITVPENTTVYYAWYSPEDYVEDQDQMRAKLIEDCFTPITSTYTASKTYVSPGENYILASFAIEADGKYGEVVVESFSTKTLPFDSTITVAQTSLTYDAATNNYTLVVLVGGSAAKVVGYNLTASDSTKATFEQNAAVHGAKDTYYGYQFAAVQDGTATLTIPHNSYKANYYVTAVTIADNAVSALAATTLEIDLKAAFPSNFGE